MAESDAFMAELLDLIRRHDLQQRVEWRGFIPDEEKRRLYAECLAVVYPPVDEDYGYITLEAMLAGKAVVTTRDSGGPTEFVVDSETGLLADADPGSLALLLDEMWAGRDRVRAMGRAGADRFAKLKISWDNVIDVLTS